MRFRFLFAIVAALTVIAGGCGSSSDGASDDTVVDVSSVLAEYQAARNAGDLDALMALYADDAVVVDHPLDDDGTAQGIGEIRQLEAIVAAELDSVTEFLDLEISGDTVIFAHKVTIDDRDCFAGSGDKVTVVGGKITLYDWGVDDAGICPAPVIDDTVEAGVVQMYLPASPSTSDSQGPPLIVLIPGGGWETADPTGLISLAESLADKGAIVATTTYRASSNGVFFPETVQDVACTIAEAAVASVDAGFEYGKVVVVGHSAGAHLAGLVTLRPGEFVSTCTVPAVAIDRFVGLAGPYDVTEAQDAAASLFGPQNPNPADWSPGNPIVHAANEPHVDILLVHGTADQTVPIQFTESFAAALENGSHNVTTSYPESVDHNSLYSSEVASPLIADWLNL